MRRRRLGPIDTEPGRIMRYLNFNELRAKLGGRGRSSIYRDIEAGYLPAPTRLGGRNYWVEHDVDAALAKLPKPLEVRLDKGETDAGH